ncbi:MAG: hypothetical protein AAB131_03030, partial [Actinomycetota bacterium]
MNELLECVRVGITPFVDRLVRVADDDERDASVAEAGEECEFLGAAVLGFVDDDLCEPLAQEVNDVGMLGEELRGVGPCVVTRDVTLVTECVVALQGVLLE